MIGGILPLMLLGAAIGLMLAFAPKKVAGYALIAVGGAALIGFFLPVLFSADVLFVGVLVSVLATSILVYLPVARWSRAILPLSINGGLWIGASASLAIDRPLFALGLGLLPLVVLLPAHWLVRIKFDIVIKVLASWMIAIASLSMFVSLMPTPGYKPDHME